MIGFIAFYSVLYSEICWELSVEYSCMRRYNKYARKINKKLTIARKMIASEKRQNLYLSQGGEILRLKKELIFVAGLQKQTMEQKVLLQKNKRILLAILKSANAFSSYSVYDVFDYKKVA